AATTSAPAGRCSNARERTDECENRHRRRHRHRPRRRDAPDVSHPVRLLQRRHRPRLVRQEGHPHRHDAGHLCRQLDHRLPHGPLPPEPHRRRPPQAVGRPEARRDDADDDRRPELHRDTRRRAERRQELRGLAMRTIKTTNGLTIALDGDLLSVMEALYREVTAKRELERSFEDMVKEIHHLIDQMDEGERRAYLAESLFLNTVKYENDKLESYMKKL